MRHRRCAGGLRLSRVARRTRERAPSKHTAMSDIKDSLEELRWYKRHLFKSYNQVKEDSVKV